MPSVLISVLIVISAGALLLLRHRRGRARLYRELAALRTRVAEGRRSALKSPPDLDGFRQGFAAERIVRIPAVLPAAALAELREECEANLPRAERSFIPGHKKGGTLSYEAIHRHAPACLAFFHSPALRELVSAIVAERLLPAADHDQSASSILFYDQPGDHINWHFDHNFYRGRHFTVLLSLVNRAADGGVSAGMLQQRKRGGEVVALDTSENVLVIFEGARVFHRASPVAEGDRRIMLSMTFTTDPRIHPAKELIRRIKDTAYYGPRALVD